MWLCYADAIYRQVSSVADDRIEQLQRYGFALHRVDDDLSHPASGAKRRAIACYASQIKGLEQAWPDGVSDAFRPEQYWRVVPSNDHRAAVAP